MPFQYPTQQGREGYGLPSTERQHDPSAAENALCALRVPGHDDGAACVRWQGDGHAELLECLGGAERCYAAGLSPVGRYGGSAAAGHTGAGGPGRHRRQEGAKRMCGAPDKREGLRATSQKHSGHVTETTDDEATLNL